MKLHKGHLDRAKEEHECYRKACKLAENNLASLGEEFDYMHQGSQRMFAKLQHYSFDYAQLVHTPSNPMQPGPIYFKTPRKCVSSLYELGSVVETSSPTGVNRAQLAGTQDGKVIVIVYDCSAFL